MYEYIYITHIQGNFFLIDIIEIFLFCFINCLRL